ncbi:MAG: class C sortase [Suipraeoptans sp.]
MNKKDDNKRRNIGPILFLLVFLVGSGLLFYPRISYWWAQYNQNATILTYNTSVSGLSYDEKEELFEIAEDYNKRMVESIVKDPFASTENIDPFDEYYDTLDIGEGIMGYIRIPGISVRIPIYHGTSDEVLDKGVGHIKATALPIGGLGQHTVLTGHSGLANAKMFDDLENLEIGEEFYLEILDRTFAYRVDQIKVVDPDDVSDLIVSTDKDYTTLITCTPYGINSHRLLVRGERVDYDDTYEEEVGIESFPWWIIVLIITLIILVYIIGKNVRKRSERRNANE